MKTQEMFAHTTARSRPSARRWTWWLIPKPFDIVSTSLYLSVVGMYFYSMLHDCQCSAIHAWWAVGLIIGATVFLLCIDRIEYWRYGEETPRRIAILLLVARIVLIEVVSQIDHFRFSPFLYLILPFLACLYFGNVIVGYWLAAADLVIYVAKHTIYHHALAFNTASEIDYLFVFAIALIFVMSMARAVLTEKDSRARAEQLLTELEASHQQLKAYSAQVADLATTRERNRLARDIHDTLGHYLTVIAVQLEKALAFRARKPEVADQAVSDAKRLAGEALQDVRRSVGALRTTEELFAFWPSMNALIEQTRTDQCLLTLHVEGREDGYSKQRLLTLYRVAQEGLTNIRKHAQARNVQLDLCFGEQEATFSLRDDGCGFNTATVSSRDGGYGLLGIQERLEFIGGTLTIESASDKGTRLLVMIPKNS